MASPSIKPTRKLSKRQLFLIYRQLDERKYSVCFSCDPEAQIVSLDEANEHRDRGHSVLDCVASKAQQVN